MSNTNIEEGDPMAAKKKASAPKSSKTTKSKPAPKNSESNFKAGKDLKS